MGNSCCNAELTGREATPDGKGAEAASGGAGADTYSINIEREDGVPFGINVDSTDGYSARLTELEPVGSFASWNRSHSKSEQVRQGDHIVAVNGVRGSAPSFLQCMQKAQSLQIEIHRPRHYTITVTKDPEGLGIETMQADNANSLMVVRLMEEGAIPNWNAVHQELPVGRHDRILSVNGKSGSWSELREKIVAAKVGDGLHLVLAAAPPRPVAKPPESAPSGKAEEPPPREASVSTAGPDAKAE